MAISLVWMIYQFLNISYNIIHKEQQFRHFIKLYNKSYTLSSPEYWHRFTIFQQALEKIDYLNSQRKNPKDAFFGLTPFADLTLAEFKEKVMTVKVNRVNLEEKNINHKRLLSQPKLKNDKFTTIIKDLPQYVDWRTKGIIGDVIAQGKCGSCWAHSVSETISSMVALKTGHYVRLSAQQLLDCSVNNYGCNGGDLCDALSWIVENNVSLVSDKEYPLRSDSGHCLLPKPSKGVHIHSNYTCRSENGHEVNMLKLIANHGPLMAAADASTWQYYVNGTIHNNCGNDANHAVQIVGYNLKDDIPYYITRNTWGTNWGMDGYLQIAIGNNTCDITAEVASVWVKSID